MDDATSPKKPADMNPYTRPGAEHAGAAFLPKPPEREGNTFLYLIGAFKLFKAALLLVLAFGVLKLLHKDVAEEVEHWIQSIRIDPHGRHARLLLEKLTGVDDKVLEKIGAASLLYATLLLVEGIGLCLRQHWAEYLTVVMTASFIPLEIYELTRRQTVVRFAIFAINVAILVYLVLRLRRENLARKARQHAAETGH